MIVIIRMNVDDSRLPTRSLAKCTPEAIISDNFEVRAISCDTLSEQPTNDDHSDDNGQCGSDDDSHGGDISHGVVMMVTVVIIVVIRMTTRMFSI